MLRRSSTFGAGHTSLSRQTMVKMTHSRRGAVKAQAVFEKFTERSVKAVQIAQQEARQLGAAEVGGHPLLLVPLE